MLAPQQMIINAQNLLLHVLAILLPQDSLLCFAVYNRVDNLTKQHQVPAEEGRSHTPKGNSAATPALSLPTSILPYPTATARPT